MFRRYACVALALLVLVACGGTGTAPPASAPAPAGTPAPAAAKPEDTVTKALDTMTQKDEAALTELFDTSVGNLKSTLAFQAIRDWMKISSDAQVPGAVGPAQSRQIQSPEARGQATVVRVNVTHQRGASAWEFTMNQTADGWRLVEIHGQVTEQKQP
jgi:hypothetical protein